MVIVPCCRLWRRQGVDSGVLESVAGAFEGQDVGVVDDAVDHRRGDDLITEYVSPAGEGQVRGQNQRGVFVAAGDQLEEQVGRVLLEGDVADLVDDEQTDATQLDQLGGQPPCIVGGFKASDPVHRGGEGDAMSGLGGFDGQSDS